MEYSTISCPPATWNVTWEAPAAYQCALFRGRHLRLLHTALQQANLHPACVRTSDASGVALTNEMRYLSENLAATGSSAQTSTSCSSLALRVQRVRQTSVCGDVRHVSSPRWAGLGWAGHSRRRQGIGPGMSARTAQERQRQCKKRRQPTTAPQRGAVRSHNCALGGDGERLVISSGFEREVLCGNGDGDGVADARQLPASAPHTGKGCSQKAGYSDAT